MEFSKDEIEKLCEYVYHGLNPKEALRMLDPSIEVKAMIDIDKRLLRVMTYAKTKAKYDLLKRAHEMAMDEKSTLISMNALKNLLSSRFGMNELKEQWRMQDRHHQQQLAFKQKALRQYADIQSAKMIQDATASQLESFQKLEEG